MSRLARLWVEAQAARDVRTPVPERRELPPARFDAVAAALLVIGLAAVVVFTIWGIAVS